MYLHPPPPLERNTQHRTVQSIFIKLRSKLVMHTTSGHYCTVYCTLIVSLIIFGDRRRHGRMNYKDNKPYMSTFLSVDLLTDFVVFCITDFIDWRCIHPWFVFSTQLVNCCPQGRGNYTCVQYCCPSTVPSLWPPPPFPPFPNKMYSIYRQCVGVVGVGGVEMYCGPYSADLLHSVSDQIQNLQNYFTTPNKNDP